MSDFRAIIKSAAVNEASAKDDVSFKLSDAQSVIAQQLAVLKEIQAVDKDQRDLQAAIKYLEGGAILLGRIIQRNIQKP